MLKSMTIGNRFIISLAVFLTMICFQHSVHATQDDPLPGETGIRHRQTPTANIVADVGDQGLVQTALPLIRNAEAALPQDQRPTQSMWRRVGPYVILGTVSAALVALALVDQPTLGLECPKEVNGKFVEHLIYYYEDYAESAETRGIPREHQCFRIKDGLKTADWEAPTSIFGKCIQVACEVPSCVLQARNLTLLKDLTKQVVNRFGVKIAYCFYSCDKQSVKPGCNLSISS